MEGTVPLVATFIVVIALILYGSHLFSKFIASGSLKMTHSKKLKVEDRILVGKDSSIAVVKVGGRYFLVGISPTSMTNLAELSEEDVSAIGDEDLKASEGLDFKKALYEKYIGLFKK